MQYTEKLKVIKEEKKLTNVIISKAGDIALSTVTRVFNESAKGASFETMIGIAKGMGISLDELAGLKQPDEQPIASPIIETISTYTELLKEKDERIREKDEVIKGLEKDKNVIRSEKYKLVGALVILVIILLALASVLVWFNIDVRNGNFGRFRY